jgi:limonene-1,2-epoxide hydrolase
MARADGTVKAAGARVSRRSQVNQARRCAVSCSKTLEFGLIMGGQPVPGGVVFEPPPPEPGSSVALEVTSVLSVGDQVIAEWTSRATARGGAAYHNRNIGIFTVRDGKIAAVREYTDTQHAAHVLFGTP